METKKVSRVALDAIASARAVSLSPPLAVQSGSTALKSTSTAYHRSNQIFILLVHSQNAAPKLTKIP